VELEEGKKEAMKRPALVFGAFAFALGLLAAPWAAAQETIPHLVLALLEESRGRVMAYRVHHEIEQITYIAVLAPDALEADRCQLRDVRYLAVTQAEGQLPSYEGKDKRPCRLVKFAPDVAPEGEPPASMPCPNCPGR